MKKMVGYCWWRVYTPRHLVHEISFFAVPSTPNLHSPRSLARERKAPLPCIPPPFFWDWRTPLIKPWLLLKFVWGRNLPLSLTHHLWPFSRFLVPFSNGSHWKRYWLSAMLHCQGDSILKTPGSHYQARDCYRQTDRGVNRSASQVGRHLELSGVGGGESGAGNKGLWRAPRLFHPLQWRALDQCQVGKLPFATPSIVFVFLHLHRFEPVKHQPMLFL